MDDSDMGSEMMDGEGQMDHGPSDKLGSLFLSPSMLPSGMKLKAGEVIEFKVVGTDQDGDTEIVYNTGDKKESEDGYWNDLRQEMSARNPEEAPM